MTDTRAFRGFRFPAEVILWAVRWYLQFPVSYRDLERMLADRGVAVDHTTMYRWVQRFAPELEKRIRRHLRSCRGPWHVDETYVRVDGQWRYLYRAVDGTGQTVDFLLSAKRDKRAAKRFFRRALTRDNTCHPGKSDRPAEELSRRAAQQPAGSMFPVCPGCANQRPAEDSPAHAQAHHPRREGQPGARYPRRRRRPPRPGAAGRRPPAAPGRARGDQPRLA